MSAYPPSHRTEFNTGYNAVETRLFSRPFPPAYARQARLIAKMLNKPFVCVALVDQKRKEVVIAGDNLAPDQRRMAAPDIIWYELCELIRTTEQPLVVDDIRNDLRFSDHLSLHEMQFRSFCGVPITMPDVGTVGALCVVSAGPYYWMPDQIAALESMAETINDQTSLQHALAVAENKAAKAERLNRMRETIASAFMSPDLPVKERFNALLKACCDVFQAEYGCISRVTGGVSEELFSYRSDADKSMQFPCALRMPTMIPNESSLECLRQRVLANQSVLFCGSAGCGLAGPCNDRPVCAPQMFISAPLIVDGVVFGTFDFVSRRGPDHPWAEEEVSLITVTSMLVCVQLSFLDQIRMLRASQTTLLCENEKLRQMPRV